MDRNGRDGQGWRSAPPHPSGARKDSSCWRAEVAAAGLDRHIRRIERELGAGGMATVYLAGRR
jgi:hypothetical protein